MILTITKRQYVFRFFAALTVLALISCENQSQQTDNNQDQTKEEQNAFLEYLPDTLQMADAKEYINDFRNASVQGLGQDFFFAGEMENGTKVHSFRLGSEQRVAFFEKLQRYLHGEADSVWIRVHLALRGEDATEVEVQLPELALLLELVQVFNEENGKTRIEEDSTFYPVRPFIASFLSGQEEPDSTCFQKVIQASLIPTSQRIITRECAAALVENWDSIRTEDVTKQLYLKEDAKDKKDRLLFYTFDGPDAAAISEKGYEYLYLHFGQLVQPDYIPLRAILQISNEPYDVSQTIGAAAAESEYLEFARPCPPVCDTSQSQFVPQILE